MKALCEGCLQSFDLRDEHDAAEYAYHDCEGEDRMTTIEPGRYTIRRDGSPHVCSLEWWDEVSDTVRERAVADALDLPAEIVEIVTDSDEEFDLASVWLVTDDHEQAIGHVTTETDGTIVVEVLDDMQTE